MKKSIEHNKNLLEEVTKRFNEKTEEIKRHFDVSVEELKSQFKVYGEQLSDIEKKVVKIDSLVEDMDYVKSTLANNKERFKEAADRTVVDDHEKRLVKLESAALAKA